MNIYKLPPIGNWELFQDLCADLWDNKLVNYTVKQYGRRGQKQKGIDIICKFKNQIIGIQCKCMEKLTTNDIDKELEKLEELNIKLDEYIIATTVSRDANLDEYVIEKSQEMQYSFDFYIVYWEDIEDDLFKEKNLSIIKDYYPKYSYDDSQLSKILSYGIEQFKSGNYKSAESCLNSVKNSLEKFSRKNKYELCILEGKYLELCRKYVDAGEKFIQAYAFSFKDIKAKYYLALGLFYKDAHNKAREICYEILDDEPLNQYFYSILILIDKENVEIPKEIFEYSEIQYNLAVNAYLNKNYQLAYEYFKKSNCKTPIQLINCVNVRFQLFLNNDDFPVIINQKNYNKLIKIETIFQENINKFSDSILVYYIDQLLRLLSINNLLKNFESLKENVERGLRISKTNEEILFYKAILLEKNNDDESALEILKKNPEVLDSFRLIALISIKNNDYQQIIDFGEKIIDSFGISSEQYLSCQYALIDAYIKVGKSEDAVNLINSEKNSCRQNLLKSKLYLEKPDKIKYLLASYKQINQGFIIDKLQLALEFSKLNEFELAISIYESILDLKIFSNIINDLAYCYYYNGDYCKLIDLNENFIKNNEYHQYLIEFEINAFLKINDYENVLRLIGIYLEHVENKYSMRLLKAKIYLFKEKFDIVDDFIKDVPDFDNLNSKQCLEFYAVCKHRVKNILKLFEILWDIRKAHMNDDIDVHKIYTQEILDAKLSFINPLKVEYGVGVLIKIANKKDLIYISKNNRDLRKFGQFEKILNLKKGDKIVLETNVELEILDIYNKFNFAFKESLEILQLNSYNYLKMYTSDSIEENIIQIKEITLERRNRLNYLKNQYISTFKPIQVFSEISGLDMYDSYFYLKESGLKSFSDNDFQNTLKNDIILDTTSLLTIHLLNIEEIIAKNYNLYISTSEYFLLKHIHESIKPKLSYDLVVGYDNYGEFRSSNPNYKEKFDFISKIINWINKNCKITESKALFNLNKKDAKNINQIPYKNIQENILLGYEDYILISDDLDLKILINKFFKITTCGTLSVIEDMHYKQIIDDDGFKELNLKLYELNFKKVPLTAETLFYAVKKENYNLFIKFIFDYAVHQDNYLNFNWDFIIKKLNIQNIYEKILFEMIIKLLSNLIFINYCDPLLIKLDSFGDEKYIASKNSNIFHIESCCFAKKISEKNKLGLSTN